MNKKDGIKISVIIPVYNVERTLEKCIRSIMNQDFKDIEIICINDGSIDNSLQILERLADEDDRIFIIDKKNEGLAEVRNLGIRLAKGKYIQYIDSDDYLEQGYLKKAYEISEKYELDILIFDYYYNRNNSVFNMTDISLNNNVTLNGKEYLDMLFNIDIPKTTFIWNKLIRKKLYIENNIVLPKDLNIGEDVYYLFLLSYYANKIGKCNNRYYHYIFNIQSLTNNKLSLKLYNIIYLFQKLNEFFINKKDINITKKILENNEFKHLFKIIYLESYFENEKYVKTVLRFLKLIKNVDDSILKKEKFILKIAILILKKYPTLLCFKRVNIILVFFRKIKQKLKGKK